MTSLTPSVQSAVKAVRDHFAEQPVEVADDGVGGGYVIVDRVAVGPSYIPATTWLGFHISAAYPASDVYPHYIGPLARADGRPHGPAFQPHTWKDRPCLQVSRRSNRWNPTIDNAALKAEKVLAWIAAQ